MSLFSVLSVSASGMAAQRTRAEIVAENLANADTTRTPDGGPYRRQDVVFESILAEEMKSNSTGVSVSGVMVDEREPERRYSPGHPDADKDGYVAMPRINPAEADDRPDGRIARISGQCRSVLRSKRHDSPLD